MNAIAVVGVLPSWRQSQREGSEHARPVHRIASRMLFNCSRLSVPTRIFVVLFEFGPRSEQIAAKAFERLADLFRSAT